MIMSKYLVFDWGGTALKYALMNEEADILEKGSVPSPSRDSSKDSFFAIIDPVVNKYRAEIDGIAISSAGIIDSVQGIIQVVGVFPFLNGCPIAKEMEERYGVRVTIENDGKSAALAEHWRGSLKGCDSGAVVVIGTAIGGGLILDGRLRRGKDFLAGEFSSMIIDVSRRDETEGYWSSLGYRGLLNRYTGLTGEEAGTLTGKEFFRRLEEGDEKAKEALGSYTDALAATLFSLNMLLNLECISIGGGISEQPALMESLQASIEAIPEWNPDMRAGTNLPLPAVTVCVFHNDANLIGALFHHLSDKLETQQNKHKVF
jgi:predicted NBD/HSP70 family sugar kinase